MIVCHEWEENTKGRDVGPPDHCASCKMTRLSPGALVSPPPPPRRTPSPLGAGHMYSRGWTKVIGDIMEANGRVRGLSVPHVWTSQHNGNPFFGVRRNGRTDGWMDPTTSDTPMKIPGAGCVCATTKQQLRRRDRQNSATPSSDQRVWSFGGSRSRGEICRTRGFLEDNGVSGKIPYPSWRDAFNII